MTCSGARHAVQRSNRVRLKADCYAMLDKLRLDQFVSREEIVEMQIRLHPPTGAAAPIVLTGYTGPKGKARMPHETINWKAEGLFDDNGFSAMRYRKD